VTRPYELPQIFSMLARLETRLRVAVDAGLQREHHLSLASFDAMKEIAGFPEGCGPDDIAESLVVGPHDADVIIDALISAGHAFRKPSAAANDAAAVVLTLSGALLLKRAGRTLERVLHAQLDPMLSPSDQGLLQESLRALL
jgi:DNA-binding MarR family transcriptional regulator